jgi:hypothetical protein
VGAMHSNHHHHHLQPFFHKPKTSSETFLFASCNASPRRFLPAHPHYVEVSNDGKVAQFEVTK